MKKTLVAVDPMALEGKGFKNFCEKIRLFQEKEIFSEASIASVIHSALYAAPNSYYKSKKKDLAKEARNNVKRSCKDKFQFDAVRVLESNSSTNDEMVERLSRHGNGLGADLLVLSSNDRKGLPYWFLGSLSETASLLAPMPVLIFKTSVPPNRTSRSLRFVIAVDVAAPPSASDINWVADLARSTKANLELVYVEPRKRTLVDSLQQRKSKADAKKILQRLLELFLSKGAGAARATVLTERQSIAHTITDFSEKQGAWLTITTAPKRSKTRRLFLGSSARHVLALTKRPFLSLRAE